MLTSFTSPWVLTRLMARARRPAVLTPSKSAVFSNWRTTCCPSLVKCSRGPSSSIALRFFFWAFGWFAPVGAAPPINWAKMASDMPAGAPRGRRSPSVVQ